MERKKVKRIYEPVKVMKCPRCKCNTMHSLIDYDNKLYKCNICKTVHA